MWNREGKVFMEKKNPFQLEVVSVRLVKDAPIFSKHKITEPEDAVAVLGEILCEMDREVICVINVAADGTPINCHFASVGALNQAVVNPRELFKASILSNAAYILLMHNHPSGTLKPSEADTRMTDRILKVSELLGIPLMDHIIVGGDNSEFFSFREKKMIKQKEIPFTSDYRYLEFEEKSVVAEKERCR